jgi:TonB family protein
MLIYQDSSKLFFFDTLIRKKQRRLFWKAFVISFICYFSLIAIFFVIFQHFSSKTGLNREVFIKVLNAEYVPFPQQETLPLEEASETQSPNSLDKSVKVNKEKPQTPILSSANKDDIGWEYKINKPDKSWREKIASITEQESQKKIDIPKPNIEVTTKTVNVETKNQMQSNTNTSIEGEKEVLLYSRKLQAVIRNHWSVPEDLAIKYGNKPVEVEVEIDIAGNLINYVIKNSSGNNVYDASIKDAIKKSFPFLAPPKNLFQTSFKSTKITIVFRL